MKIKLEMTETVEDQSVQVLVINGGAESVAATLTKKGDRCEVDIAAPLAVVLRETPAI